MGVDVEEELEELSNENIPNKKSIFIGDILVFIPIINLIIVIVGSAIPEKSIDFVAKLASGQFLKK